jgi:maltose alpha-D-glucosyltransferase/alpha-amylase
MGTPGEMPLGAGRLRFSRTSAYEGDVDAEALGQDVLYPSLDQSNTGVFFGNRIYLKGYRRLQSGISPELEVGHFLTDQAHFAHRRPVRPPLPAPLSWRPQS